VAMSDEEVKELMSHAFRLAREGSLPADIGIPADEFVSLAVQECDWQEEEAQRYVEENSDAFGWVWLKLREEEA
jgi:hypothetical protein